MPCKELKEIMTIEILKLVEDNINEREWRVKSTGSFMPKECMSAYKIILAVTALISEFKPLMKCVDKQ